MTSVQKNEGKANHANPFEQAATHTLQMEPTCPAHSLTEEWRQNHIAYWRKQRQIDQQEYQSSINRAANREYADIHEIVDRFVGEMHSIDNVEVLHELYYAWMSHKKIDKRKAHQKHITFNTLRIIAFLTQLHELWTKKQQLGLLTGNDAEEGLSHE